jgi:radical SAM protein with 4Fe4S-binding SPASM domain
VKYVNNIKAMNEAFINHYSASNSPSILSFPEEVTITASLKCNYRCSMCYQKNFSDELDFQAVEKIRPILPFAKTLQVFGGEPLLYPGVEKLYQIAHENNCNITMISNGSLLTERMINSILDNQVMCIKISLDAGTPETYKRIRGGDFFKVLRGVGLLTKGKLERGQQTPILDFNFLAMRSNVGELIRLLVLAKELGIRAVNVFYPLMQTEEMAKDSVYFDQKYSDEMLIKARETAKQLGVGLNLPALFCESETAGGESGVRSLACRDPWTKALIGVNGDLSLCCGGAPYLGNLLQHEFEDLWNNEKAQAIRKVVNTPQEPGYCKRCRIRKGDPRDVKMHMSPEIAQKINAELAA